ncbi:NACHT domain-containing protein [Ferruginibacter profundus]
MEEKLIKVIIEAFIKQLVSESKNIFNSLYDEGKQFLGKSVKKYLEKHKTKFSSFKTLLKGNTPVYLYDIYYPINLNQDHKKTIDTSNIKNLFADGNYVTIIGDAGSGKSTLIKHLFLNSIKEQFALPILIELRYLNGTNGNIEEFICEHVFENKLSVNGKILEKLFEKGKFVFFLDGFDELNSDIRNHVIKSLNLFMSAYDENKFILTSRPYSNIESLSVFRNLHIKKLEPKEINEFIELQLKGEKELAKKIQLSIKESKSSYIESFLANPLLLTLYILTFQTYAEIPDKKYIFYRRVVNALFSEHDSKTKLGYIREKKSQLNQEQFEEILKAFSLLSYFDEHFYFDFDYVNSTFKKIKQRIKSINFDNSNLIDDLKSAVALWVEDNGKYSFVHRSLQEYFAASFIKNLNPEENERAYKKMIERFSKTEKRLSEYSNFLSLCNEMDEINFYTFYYLPLLKELRSNLDNSSRDSLVKSFILYFTDKVKFVKQIDGKNEEIYKNIHIRNEVYRTIYLHLDYTQQLYDELNVVLDKLWDGLVFDVPKAGEARIEIILDVEKDILKHCTDSAFYRASNAILLFVEKEIVEKERKIQQSLKTDKDLIDLI